ncbi:flagellar basal body-associated FliL family protein [Calycomorphotria hydatis]|uniref:Flagellar protein FliL n=1 Tax=Calycomorphotria hydatis TaxID=2528027 RepID=A0A517TB87_9PLAN|nr:flagellar basal body-associated FliL family protein [Calycomorphotria hydatis]QDT65639.1 hypothetical protein V22_28980 [Calycomorphotria hydatis]
MATDAPEQAEAAVHASAEAPAKSGGLLANPIVLIAILLTVMTAEGAILYVILPSPSAAASVDEEELGADIEPEVHTVEVFVDNFTSTNSLAAHGSVIHLNFKLTAIVASSQEIAFDQAANTDNKARVRQAVLKVARKATLEDLNDPSLSTFKRLIREEINKVLRKSYIIEVVISDFKTMEQ